jgi:hypothetical protein
MITLREQHSAIVLWLGYQRIKSRRAWMVYLRRATLTGWLDLGNYARWRVWWRYSDHEEVERW